MRAVRVRARADLRHRFLSWLALAVLVGITGGAAIAVASAARRTDTAYTRFLAAHAPSDVSITDSKDFLTKDLDLDEVEAMPEVERSIRASFVFFLGRTADGRALTTGDFIPIAGPRGALGVTLDRWKVLDGRRFDPAKVDEAVVDYEAARDLGLEVGDSLTLRFIRRTVFDREIVPYIAGIPARVSGQGTAGAVDRLPFDHEPEITFRIVGIVADPVTFPPVPGQFSPYLRLTPAFHDRYVHEVAHSDVLFADLADVTDLDSFKADVAQLSGGAPVFYGLTQSDHAENVNRTLHLAAVVLWMLAGLIAIATAMIAMQALSRQAFVESIEHPVLRALGMTSRERFAVGLVRTASIAVAATIIAVAVAVLLSPLWPIGLARVAEPSPGLEVNVAVVGTGALAVLLGVLVIGSASTWRWSRAPRHRSQIRANRLPWTARVLGEAIRPLPLTLGARQALDGGRGRNAVPMRTTMIAAALAVATLTTALTFGSSLGHLLDTPRLYGWSWDAQVGGRGYPDLGDAMSEGLDASPHVAAYSTGTVTEVSVNGVRVEALAMRPGAGAMPPALLEGRAPRGDDEIVVGTQTLRAADATVGSRVRVRIGDASRRFRVVGRAVFPDVGDIGQLGRGAFLRLSAVDRVGGVTPRNTVLIRFRDGTDRSAAVAELTRAIAPIPVAAAALPRDLASFGRVDGLPLAVAAILGLMAGSVLVYTLLAAIRRRRHELAILKTLGFVRREVAGTVAAQALTLVVLALLIGLPLGVAIGRIMWRTFADWQGIPPVPSVEPGPLVLVAAAMLVAGLLIAVVPAILAARTSPAADLRTE